MAQVIDWEEAMQQCGEDEEFLRELLEDLREETKTQMDRMVEIIRNPTDNPHVAITRAAHVIKGAASNLMCYELRDASMELENAAQQADTIKIQNSFQRLQTAVSNYNAYLVGIGV